MVPGTEMDSYVGNDPEKLYKRPDRMAVVYEGTLDRSMPCQGNSSTTSGLLSSLLLSDATLARLAAALGMANATVGGIAPEAIKLCRAAASYGALFQASS